MPLPFLDLLAQEQAASGYHLLIDKLARTPLSHVVIVVFVLTIVRLGIFPLLTKTAPHKRGMGYGVARFLNEVLDAVIYAGVFVFLIIRPFGIQAFLIPSGSMWPTLYVNDFIVANKAIYRYTDPKRNDVVVFEPPVEATYASQRDPDGTVNVDFIKRLIGVPGDVVELRDGVLYRNGQPAEDPNRHYSDTTDEQNFTEMPEDRVKSQGWPSFKFIKWKGQVIPLNYLDHHGGNTASNLSDNYYQVADKYVLPTAAEQMAAEAAPAVAIPQGYYFFMGDNRNNSFDGRGWGLVKRSQIIGRAEFIWLPITRIGRIH